jgi:LCP family protein required for cell wall assembly
MRKRTIIFGTLGIALLLIAIFVGIPLIQKWNQPLGESLALPTQTATNPVLASTDPALGETATLEPAAPTDAQETPVASATPLPTNTPTLTPTATPVPLCGGPPSMTILALGTDSRADNYLYGLADVIKIVRVDFVTPKVTVFTLPRDLWVEIPEIADHGVTHGKLNQSYFFGTDGMGYYDGPGGAPGLMARTLQQNFGLMVDHYGTVNMVTFTRIVDAVGGIDVYLERDVNGRPVDDKTEDMGYFYAGINHFNGDAALRFSRVRKTDNGLARMDRQKMVLCALKDKLLQPAVLPQIPELIGAFEGSVVTDLSLAQMSQMACLLPKLGDDSIIFGNLPEEEMTQSRVWDERLGNYTFVWNIDYDLIRDYITQFEAGTWPVPDGESSSCPPPVITE